MRTNCLPGSGWRSASWQHRSKASFVSLNSFMMSGVIGILALASAVLSSWKNGVSRSVNLGVQFWEKIKNLMFLWSAFLDRGNFSFSKNLVILCFCGAALLDVIVRPRKFISCTQKWHLAMLSLRPAFLRHWKPAQRFLINCSGVLVAMPISPTHCAHWSALMIGSRFSIMNLENAVRERLSPCANRRYANVLLAKLNAKSSIAGRSFEGKDTHLNNRVFRTSFSQPYAVLHLSMF